ncbi:DNA ligase 1 [Phytophthora citrophthora]|uniref:DNA ligase n=1 Tax=Phytophthora citrophthora TaxID=4793 RepID=A0AAD9GUY5_9STRA|nr:DNA ligase 1 [Phytophthora citrophthora]
MQPGRRRLRQRVVEEDDEDSDLDLPMSKKEDVIDMTSPASTPEKAKSPKKKAVTSIKVAKSTKKKTMSPIKVSKSPKKQVKKNSSPVKQEESETEEAEDNEEVKPKNDTKEEAKAKVETKIEVKKTEVKKTNTKKETAAPAGSKTGFFSPVLSKKYTTKSTSADEKKTDVKTEKESESKQAAEKQEDGDEPKEIPYFDLAHLFTKIEEITGRLVIQDLLTAFFRDVIRRSPDDLLACIYLCVCVDLAPPFENLKIGIGDAILMKAIGEATGANLKFIKEMYHKEGDLGKVAQNARSKQKTLSFTSLKPATSKGSGLTVQHVYNQFVKIAKMTGNNSQQQKCSIIKGLLVKCEKEKKDKGSQSAGGAKYIIRGLQGKLRIGLAEKSILMGLTYAFMTDKDYKDKEKQQEALAFVKKAFAECPSYNALVAAFYEVQKEVPSAPFLRVKDFAKVAEKCVLTPGTPVSPMLARPTKAYAMVFDRFEGKPFTCEYKYDGERAQIHILPNGEMAIFSRNFENSTERFPDVTLAISQSAKKGVVQSCIVDAEVVAVDRATNKRLPFQILSTRSRKNVKVEDIKVPVCIYAFDLLFLNGESFLSTPLAQRREKLREMFKVKPGNFEFATSLDVEDGVDVKDNPEAMEEAVDKVRNFLEEAVRENCEGLMVKTLEKEATYEPANRSHKWLKLKKDYLDGIGDSADLVPIGAFHGRGKRTGVYGAYLLACYDPDTEMYQPITKLGTGLSDEVLKQFYDQLKEKVVDKPPSDYAVGEGIKPDVWFEASCVWEILGADLSISPKYTAAIGLVAKDKGISLRFPRFIRIRDDKETTQATNSSQIADLYRAQGLTTVTNGDEEEDDDMLI